MKPAKKYKNYAGQITYKCLNRTNLQKAKCIHVKEKHIKTVKHRKTQKNTEKTQKNTEKHRKTHENTEKHRKTQKNTKNKKKL